MVSARVDGDLAVILGDAYATLAAEVTAAVSKAGTALRDQLRGQISSNFRTAGVGARAGGQNMVNAVRSKTYPERGRASARAAAVVSIGIPWIRAFTDGATITPHGAYLVIPTAEAEARGFDRQADQRSSFGKFSTGNRAGDANIAAATRALGPLRLVKLANGNAILVARQPGGPGVVLFVLVRQVSLRPRLDVDGPAQAALDGLAAELGTGRAL